MIESVDVTAKLELTLKSLEADKAALTAAHATAEEMSETLALLADVTDARNTLVLKASQRRERREKDKKHAEILPLCAAAKELFERCERAIEPANANFLAADSAYSFAKDALAKHEANPIPVSSYPSAKQIREWSLELHRLQRRAEEKRLDLLTKREEQTKAHASYRAAKAEFERLAFQERQLRPPVGPVKIIPTAWRVQEGPELTGIGPNR